MSLLDDAKIDAPLTRVWPFSTDCRARSASDVLLHLEITSSDEKQKPNAGDNSADVMKQRRGKEGGAKRAAGPSVNGKEQPRPRLPLHLLILKHTQGIVTAATTVGVLHYRNFHSLFFVLGSLTTSFSAKGLKLVIKEPRPPGSVVTKTHGMPSTHSSTITFMSLYLVGLLVAPLSPTSDLLAYRSLLVPLLLASPPLIMWSRVKLGLHTPEQCMVGAALGFVNTLLLSLLWRGIGSWVGLRGDVAPRVDEVIQHLEDILRGKLDL